MAMKLIWIKVENEVVIFLLDLSSELHSNICYSVLILLPGS